MLTFKNKIEYEIKNYKGLIALDIDNADIFIRDLFSWEYENETKVLKIDNNDISIKDVLIVNPTTKIIDLFNFTTKNIFLKNILNDENWNAKNVLNIEYLKSIKDKMNNNLNINFLELDTDLTKIIKNIFSLNEQLFINENIFFKWLEENQQNEFKTIILKNVEWININKLFPFTSKYNFIILTSNILKCCKNFEELELCGIVKNNELITIYDSKPIIKIIENYLNISINNQEINLYIKNSQTDIEKLYFWLKNYLFH